MTGDAVCNGIRDHDPDGSIGLVGEEQHPPYKRPPLTKGLWKGGDESKIWRSTASTASTSASGGGSSRSTPTAHTRARRRGDEYAYERLAARHGRPPRRLGGDDADVVYFRTLDDYRRCASARDGGARSSSSAAASSAPRSPLRFARRRAT